MDVGIACPNVTLPTGREAIEQISRRADELGFNSVMLADHLVRPIGDDNIDYFKNSPRYTNDLFEALVTAGFVAAITERVKIAFGVLVLTYRNPVITAKQIATLDQLSQGRMILGVGPGYWPHEFRALGIPQKDTGARTDEYIQAFRTLWSSESPEFHGRFVDIHDVLFKPRPVQAHIPIWVGGLSDAALLRAIRLADGWHLPRFSVEGIRPHAQRLQAAATSLGRDLSGFVFSNRPAVQFNRRVVTANLGQPVDLGGRPAPPPAPIVGPPEYVAEQLARFESEAGVSHLIIDLHEGEPLRSVLNAMEIFATKVLPWLRGTSIEATSSCSGTGPSNRGLLNPTA